MSLDFTDDESTLIQVMAFTWANVDPDLFHHMTWLGHSELTYCPLKDVALIKSVILKQFSD